MMALVELVALAPVSQVAAFVQLVLLQLAVATLELMVRGALMACARGGDGDALALPAAMRALGRLHRVFVDSCGPVVEPAFVGALAPGHQRLLGSAT